MATDFHDDPPGSANDAQQQLRYRFSVFELDAREGELRKQGVLIRLQGQPMQILLALLERPGLIVSRDELRQRLWPGDTFVEFDHSLNTAIKRLRETLGDTATTPRFIETVPRRGYRFMAPVERFNGTPQPSNGAPQPPEPAPASVSALASASTAAGPSGPIPGLPAPALRVRFGVAASMVVVLVAAGLLTVWAGTRGRTPTAPASAIPRLAVLGFENLTGDATRAYVADGFTEELISQLGRLAPGRLGVIARSSSASFKPNDTPFDEIARALGVDYIIEGSIRGDGDRYRIAVRLVRAHDGTALWSELYEGALLDLVTMQRDVGQQVARHLALALLPNDQAALARATTTDSRAYEAYLRGVSEMARGPGGPGEGFASASTLFKQAIAIDPHYALAYAGLAESYIRQQDYYMIAPDQAQPPAKTAATQALAIDDTLAEAHCALADVLSRTSGDAATVAAAATAAEVEFTRALALNPSRADTQLRYASHLVRTGRTRDGRARIEHARSLAPRSADVVTEAAWMELDAGHLDTAAALANEALTYQPDFPFARYVLGRVALRRAAPQDAIAQFENARVTSGHAPKYIAALATAYLAAARPADAARALDELRAISRDRYVPPGTIEHLADRLKAQSP